MPLLRWVFLTGNNPFKKNSLRYVYSHLFPECALLRQSEAKRQGSLDSYPHALVADSQNLLSIGTDDEVYLSAFSLLQEVCFHGVLGGERQVEALAPAEEMRIVRNRFRLSDILAVSLTDGDGGIVLASVGVYMTGISSLRCLDSSA